MNAVVSRNQNGNFIKVESSPVELKRSRVVLCIPFGEGGGGWKVFASKLAFMVGVGVVSKAPGQRVEMVERRLTRQSYLEVAKGGSEETSTGGSEGVKTVTINFTFDGSVRGWSMIHKHLEMARPEQGRKGNRS